MDVHIAIILLGIVAVFLLVVIVLFLGLTMLRRSAEITRGSTHKAAAFSVKAVGVLYLISLAAFLILPSIAVFLAAAAVASSIILGLVLARPVSFSWTEREMAIFFLIPAFLGMIALYYYPITQTVIYSLHEMRFTADWVGSLFIGLGNYIRAIRSDTFRQSFVFTIYFTLSTVTLCFLIGLGMALTTTWLKNSIMNQVLRTIIVVPWSIPLIINASMWRWLFNSEVGLAVLLKQWGMIEEVPVFLSSPGWAIHAVIIADAWKWSPLVAIFIIGALATIPQELYESADVDGANALTKFIRITFPMIIPTVIVALLFRTMEALRTFDLVYGMTGGGPGSTTETLSSIAYKHYFSYTNFGQGSAFAIVIFILIMFFSIFFISRTYKNFRFKT